MADTKTTASERGHEFVDVKVSWVLGTAAVLVGMILVTALAAFVMLGARGPTWSFTKPPQVNVGLPTTTPPQLQSAPALDLAALRAEKSAMLHGYHWIDRARGTVQIPIERAMQLAASRDKAATERGSPAGKSQQ